MDLVIRVLIRGSAVSDTQWQPPLQHSAMLAPENQSLDRESWAISYQPDTSQYPSLLNSFSLEDEQANFGGAYGSLGYSYHPNSVSSPSETPSSLIQDSGYPLTPYVAYGGSGSSSYEFELTEAFARPDFNIGQFPPLQARRRFMTLQERDEIESTKLLSLEKLESGRLSFHRNDELYLASYKDRVHPLFPILSQMALTCLHASPLLKAAVLALGSQSLNDVHQRKNAKQMHEFCTECLHQVRDEADRLTNSRLNR